MARTATGAVSAAPPLPAEGAEAVVAAGQQGRKQHTLLKGGAIAVAGLVVAVLRDIPKLKALADQPALAILPRVGIWIAIAVAAGVVGLGLLRLLGALTASKKAAPYLFISPFFIIFFTFGLFPILFSAYLSFQSWDPAAGLGAMKFVGVGNYTFTFTDKWFWKSIYNTFWIAIASGLPQHVVGMPLAYFFQIAYKRSRNAITGVYFLPFITSSVAVSLIFNTLFSKDFGVINATLDSLHQLPVIGNLFPSHHVDWLGKAPFTKPAISFVIWWRYVGWNTVLYLSALQAISADLFEAAEMDGASRWQTFRHVVVPLLAPMMFFAVTLTIIGNLQMFDVPYIMLGTNQGSLGGVEQSGLTTTMYLYQTGFNYGDFGTACAISWLLFIVIAALTWANQRIFTARGGTEGVA
jgi:multiple sugar transport system permease protein